MGRITINGTQSQFSCKHSIPLDMWDVKELTTDDIVDVNGDKWIISMRYKKGVPFQGFLVSFLYKQLFAVHKTNGIH